MENCEFGKECEDGIIRSGPLEELRKYNELQIYKSIGAINDTVFGIIHINDCVIMPKTEIDNLFCILNEREEFIKKLSHDLNLYKSNSLIKL